MLKVSVSQFGPVVQGSVSLKPLTIFVGQNNAGKSYMATLIYAICRSLGRGFGILPTFHSMRRFFPLYHQPHYLMDIDDWAPAVQQVLKKKTAQSVRTWVQSIAETKQEKVVLAFNELPEDIRAVLHKAISGLSDRFVTDLNGELRRCFGSDIGELTGVQEPVDEGFRLSIDEQKSLWYMRLACSDSKLYTSQASFHLENQSFELPSRIRRIATAKRIPAPETVALEVLDTLLIQALRPTIDSFPISVYYLPAARSGILQSHKALASFMVSRSPLVGIEPLDIPKLSGVVTDFIANLITLERGEKTKLYDIATFLEKDVISGEVDIDAGKVAYPEIYYRPQAGKFPLHRTSSMVSELAPIILFLKYVIAPGDFLIIEEPESHLHPAVQRKLAQAIARLIRARVRVLITSHSDYLLEQLSNIVRLSGASANERETWGYAASEYLDPDEVGAYLFQLDEQRGESVVKELTVTREDGIPMEEMGLVAEQLYEEKVQLERAIRGG